VLYDYKCLNCGEVFDDFRSVEQRHTTICPRCKKVAVLLFHPVANVQKPFDPYVDENIAEDGNPVLIESREQKKRLLKQNGLDWMPSVRWI